MEGSQVKELIQKWRVLSNELKDKNAELEKTRIALNEFEAQHAKTVQDWDLEKANIQSTISLVWAQVSNKKEELMRIEKETADLQQKVDERRLRNEEHWRVLSKRKQAVAAKLQEVEAKDKGAKEGLNEFRALREEGRRQLLALTSKIEAAAGAEAVEFQHKTRQLRSRVGEAAAAAEAEKKSWALETAVRAWNQKSEARKLLLEEATIAEREKGTWAGVVKEANGLVCEEYLRELDSLRALISC